MKQREKIRKNGRDAVYFNTLSFTIASNILGKYLMQLKSRDDYDALHIPRPSLLF